jgi:hypothetical protein
VFKKFYKNEKYSETIKKILKKWKGLLKEDKPEINNSIELKEDCDKTHTKEDISKFKDKLKSESVALRRTTKTLFFDTFVKNWPKWIERLLELSLEIEKGIYSSNLALFEKLDQKTYIKKTKTLIINLNKNKDLVENLVNNEVTPQELIIMDEKVIS